MTDNAPRDKLEAFMQKHVESVEKIESDYNL